MKRCTSCGYGVATPYYLCPDCRRRFPAMGMEWKQTGLNEITIYAPDNVKVTVAPMPTGRKFAAVMRRSVLGEIKGAAGEKLGRVAAKISGRIKGFEPMKKGRRQG